MLKTKNTGGLKCPSRCPMLSVLGAKSIPTNDQPRPQINVANKLACLGLAVNDLLAWRCRMTKTATLDREGVGE